MVQWEGAPQGTLPDVRMIEALRTLQCDIKVNTQIDTPIGRGVVTRVHGLTVTVAVVLDARTLV